MAEPRPLRSASLILAAVLVAAAWPLASGATRAQQPVENGGRADAAFRAFWEAESPGTAERAAAQVLASGADFDTIWARLKSGRRYTKQPTGVRALPATVNGVSLDNLVEVPAEYNPDKKWPVRLQLHGGVGRPAPAPGESARPLSNRIPGPALIDIHPRAWAGSEWWVSKQVDNIFTLIDRVKRIYNVDESRISITGISDGGTGVYYLAMRAATIWASCLPLNGHPLVLANPDTGADGELFIGNLVNCPMYLVNGGRDRLYPAASVAPLVAMMKGAGVSTVFQVYPDAGHDTSWWPVERPKSEAFLAAHPRSPHPERLSWETERVDRYNRIDWLVINRLGKRPSEARLEDVNTFEPVAGRTAELYDRTGRSGRVDIARKGNAFEARTRGVQQFTLLLSPDVIDFAKPVQVTVNGTGVFDGVVKRDPAMLLKWAARDDNRTMLYAAELTVSVP